MAAFEFDGELAAPINLQIVPDRPVDDIVPLTQFLGVGGVTSGSFIYRARTSGISRISLDVSEYVDLSGARTSPGIRVLADDDCTGGEVINGLRPRTRYYYGVNVNGRRMMTGMLRTFPSPEDPTTVRFAWASCQKAPSGVTTFQSLNKENLDLMIHLGDFGYPGTTDLTLQRLNYQSQYAGDFLDRVVRTMPRIHVWDDADFAGNHAHGDVFGKENSLKAFLEYIPTYPLVNRVYGVAQETRLGCVHLLMLDVRFQRASSRPRWPESGTVLARAAVGSGGSVLMLRFDDPDAIPKKGASGYHGWYADIDPEGIGAVARVRSYDPMTGRIQLNRSLSAITDGVPFYLRSASFLDKEVVQPVGQTDWLIDSVIRSSAVWKVIGSSSVWNPTYGGADSWGGWPNSNRLEQRYIVQRWQEAGVRNIIFVTGDRHVIAFDDGTHALFPEGSAGPLNAASYSVGGMFSHGVYDRGPGYGLGIATPTTLTLTPKNEFGVPVSQVQPLTITAA